jgi:hypothetical protein
MKPDSAVSKRDSRNKAKRSKGADSKIETIISIIHYTSYIDNTIAGSQADFVTRPKKEDTPITTHGDHPTIRNIKQK